MTKTKQQFLQKKAPLQIFENILNTPLNMYFTYTTLHEDPVYLPKY